MDELSKSKKMMSLSLASNSLTTLPADLSQLKELRKLILKNNPLTNLSSILSSLQTLPNLTELSISVKNSNEAELILNALPKLEVLNGVQIEDSDNDNNDPLLIEVKELYEEIKGDDSLSKCFEAQMKILLKELKSKESVSEDIMRTMKLKVNHVLVNTVFNNVIEVCSIKKEVWSKINKVYKKLFEKFVELLITVIEKCSINKGKIELSKNESKALIQLKKVIDQQKEKIEQFKALLRDTSNQLQKYRKAKETEILQLKHSTKEEIEQLELKYQEEVNKIKENESNNILILQSTIQDLQSQHKTETNKLYNNINELKLQIATLEEENKKYLDTIIKHSKDIILNLKHPLVKTLQSIITLKQLKEIINDIYSHKQKHNAKNITLEDYMYVYFEERCGSKQLAVKWAEAIVDSVKSNGQLDSDVILFGKMLQNRCDEDYRLIHLEVKSTIINMLIAELKNKCPINDNLLNLLNTIQHYDIEECTWRKIIEKMYNEEDVIQLANELKETSKTGRIKFTNFLKVINNHIIDYIRFPII